MASIWLISQCIWCISVASCGKNMGYVMIYIETCDRLVGSTQKGMNECDTPDQKHDGWMTGTCLIILDNLEWMVRRKGGQQQTIKTDDNNNDDSCRDNGHNKETMILSSAASINVLSIQACTPLPSLQLSQTSPISLNVQSFRETSEMLGKWSYFTLHCWSILWNTPQKINIESEHDGLENDFPLHMYGCFGSMLIFRVFLLLQS